MSAAFFLEITMSVSLFDDEVNANILGKSFALARRTVWAPRWLIGSVFSQGPCLSMVAWCDTHSPRYRQTERLVLRSVITQTINIYFFLQPQFLRNCHSWKIYGSHLPITHTNTHDNTMNLSNYFPFPFLPYSRARFKKNSVCLWCAFNIAIASSA